MNRHGGRPPPLNPTTVLLFLRIFTSNGQPFSFQDVLAAWRYIIFFFRNALVEYRGFQLNAGGTNAFVIVSPRLAQDLLQHGSTTTYMNVGHLELKFIFDRSNTMFHPSHTAGIMQTEIETRAIYDVNQIVDDIQSSIRRLAADRQRARQEQIRLDLEMQECQRQADLAAEEQTAATEAIAAEQHAILAAEANLAVANERMQQIQEQIFLEAEMEEEVHILTELHECDRQRDLAAASEAELTKATEAEQDAILAAIQLEKQAERKRYFEVTETVQMEIDMELLEVQEYEHQANLVAASELAARKADETERIEILVAAQMEAELDEYAQTLELVDAIMMEQASTETTASSETVLPPDNCIVPVPARFDGMPTLSLPETVGGTVAKVTPREETSRERASEAENAERLRQMQLDEVNRRLEQNAHLPASIASGTRGVSIDVPGHANGHELFRKLSEHYTRTGQLSKTGRYYNQLQEAARQCSCTKKPTGLISWCLDPCNRNEFDHIHQSLILTLKKKEATLEAGLTYAVLERMNLMGEYKKAHIRNNVNKNKICKEPIRVVVDTDTNTVTQVALCIDNVYYKEDWEHIFYEEGDEAEEILLKSDNSLAKLEKDGRYRKGNCIGNLRFRNHLYQMRAFLHWIDNKEAILSQPVVTFAQLWNLSYMFKLECGLPINELGMSHRSHFPTGINHKIINPEPTIGVN
eukprot:scaffold97115_cov30-Cyclotella_meneghiniana.AAC.2